jgi:hypothetical protein
MTSRGAELRLTADGQFTENGLPGPPPDAAGIAGRALPRSGAGTWRLYGSIAGSQDVLLRFHSGASFDLAVLWQPHSGSRRGYFILQPYLDNGISDPAYQLIKRTRL